jgi:hypothetical protein
MDITPGPGMPPFTIIGVETNTLSGGRWLLSEYKSDVMGQAFEGHGIIGYDAEKKAYASVWTDTMSTSMSHGESTFDAKTNTLTGRMELQDPMSGKAKAKTVSTWPDPDSRVVEVYRPEDAP